MKKPDDNLSALSLEELTKRAKTTKTVTWTLAGIIFIQLLTGIYLTIQQGFNVFIIIPMAFIPLLIANFTSIKKIKEEIARRNV